ncbi:MAG: hypothetical protein QF441_10275 [Bacteriovoracaceae bacterium]|jgi:hypothetical protein|nr:hypothetical protein [Halobacteriovoraceae bacterium]MDP7320985.1 hypothetical protein [Bacteriovoracaceae bacterium]|tara:strand:- start:1464 stop:1808 length:345 start_codon:yes stop_codon:yes gene_type:complete
MKIILTGLLIIGTISSFASVDVTILAEKGESFETGGTRSFIYDPQCANCASKKTQKKRAKDSAAKEADRICIEAGAQSAKILDYDLDVDYQSGWLLNIGAPRTYFAITTAKCQF